MIGRSYRLEVDRLVVVSATVTGYGSHRCLMLDLVVDMVAE